MRRFGGFLAILIAVAVSGCGEGQSDEQISETRLLLDTFCTITIHGYGGPELINEAFDLCEGYETLFSITMEGSDVWRINHADGSPVEVARETVELIETGLDYGEISGGLFDITIGRVSRLWDFGGEPYIPSETELTDARVTVDYKKVRIVGDTVQLLDPDAWIDLGAIAKGYIADKIAAFLVENGVTGAVIDLGGDVVAVGSKSDGEPWRIGLRKPQGGTGDLLGVVETEEASIVSSGVYERQFEKDGVLYHHILDPKTGRPAHSDVISATVIAKNAAAGEGLSTIAILVGSERVQELFDLTPEFTGAALVLENGDVLRFGDIDLKVIG